MHSLQTHIWHVMDDPERYGIDYKPSVYFSSGANPVAGSDDAELVMRGLRKFDYVIYHGCYHMDEMAMMSRSAAAGKCQPRRHLCSFIPRQRVFFHRL